MSKKYKHPYGGWDVAIYYLCKPKSFEFKLSKERDQEFLEVVWIDDKTKDIPDWLREIYRLIMENI